MLVIFSLPKILFTIFVVVAVWQGFKWLKRREALQNQRAKSDLNAAEQAKQPDVEEMVPCPDCGAYVAKGGDHRCT